MEKHPWDVPVSEEGRETLVGLAKQYRENGQSRELGATMCRLAHVVKHVGSGREDSAFGSSAQFAKDAVDILRQTDDRLELAKALRVAAVPFTDGVDHAALLTESLALARQMGDKEQEGWTLFRMTSPQGVPGVTVQEALACFEECDCPEGRAACLLRIAIHEHPWNVELIDEAVEIYEQAGLQREEQVARRYADVARMPIKSS